MLGKWHLGHQRPHDPLSHGFDEWLGLPFSNGNFDAAQTERPSSPMSHSGILESRSSLQIFLLVLSDMGCTDAPLGTTNPDLPETPSAYTCPAAQPPPKRKQPKPAAVLGTSEKSLIVGSSFPMDVAPSFRNTVDSAQSDVGSPFSGTLSAVVTAVAWGDGCLRSLGGAVAAVLVHGPYHGIRKWAAASRGQSNAAAAAAAAASADEVSAPSQSLGDAGGAHPRSPGTGTGSSGQAAWGRTAAMATAAPMSYTRNKVKSHSSLLIP